MLDALRTSLYNKFPQSIFEPFEITSPATPKYNCIAWAYDDNTKVYWPDKERFTFWPNSIPRETTIKAFKALYALKGYTECANSDYEEGYEKVVIFVDSNKVPTHAAKQINQTLWTSKLGPSVDISHTLNAMQNGEYGVAAVFMKRRK